MEIGSEFWIDNEPMIENHEIPSWLTKFGNLTFTSSGRAAILHVLKNIKIQNKNVLLPSYLCDSIVNSFLKSGYKCFFYDINRDLSINLESIYKFENIGIFYHLGYFGFATNKSCKSVLTNLKKRGIIIIEDVTHSLFLDFDNFEENDFYIGSIRKWFGIPDGGFVASKKYELPKLGFNNSEFYRLRLDALILKKHYIDVFNNIEKTVFLEKFDKAEDFLDNNWDVNGISELSLNIIENLDIKDLQKRRIENYNYLYDNFEISNNIEIINPRATINACPLFFTILILKNRDSFRDVLIKHNVYCPIHWGKIDNINVNEFLYDHELSIPCDQRYNLSDMDRIIKIVETLMENKNA